MDCLGEYGERFGAPAFDVEIAGDVVTRIHVTRGAPCGATWQAAERVEGLPKDEVVIRMGLEAQYFCTANPAGWDPIYGKSPVHFAGDIHAAALEKAVNR
ncbi:MAG: hypothetical protein GY859_26240 [Desulfobacterales bacterium]|nr:hypothetical protein [Desulfobacterales bacterium]